MALARFAGASLAIWAALALSTAAVAAQTVLTCSVSGQSGKCSPTVTLDQPATMVNPALLQLTVSPTASTYTAATTDMDQATGLATYKLPERLEILPMLPTTASGKVQKHVILQQLTGTAAQ